ncbi:unnamed protein product [Rhizophagus irregularis]|nr:unnamed protein product [Rhizophagus irregularis]
MIVLDHLNPDSTSSRLPSIPQSNSSIQTAPSNYFPSQHLLNDSQKPSGLVSNILLSTNVFSFCSDTCDYEVQELHSVHVYISSKLNILTTFIDSTVLLVINLPRKELLMLLSNNPNFLYPSFITLQSSVPFFSQIFNIATFNINGLILHSHTKIIELLTFLEMKNISFCGVVDIHLFPKRMKFLGKYITNYTVISSDLDTSHHARTSGGVSLLIHNFIASHIQTYQLHSSRILSVNLYFKDNARNHHFYHAVCEDFNIHLDKYYSIFINQSQTATKSMYKLMYYLLSHNYEEYTSHNFSVYLGTYQHNDLITCIDYVWSCLMLKGYNLMALIFNAHDICTSDYNPVISYFDASLIFSFTNSLYDVSLEEFNAWYLNRKCEFLQSQIVKAAIKTLPNSHVSNQYTLKVLKDLDLLIQNYRFVAKVTATIQFLIQRPEDFSFTYEAKWSHYLLRLSAILVRYKNIFMDAPPLPDMLAFGTLDSFISLYSSLSHVVALFFTTT